MLNTLFDAGLAAEYTTRELIARRRPRVRVLAVTCCCYEYSQPVIFMTIRSLQMLKSKVFNNIIVILV